MKIHMIFFVVFFNFFSSEAIAQASKLGSKSESKKKLLKAGELFNLSKIENHCKFKLDLCNKGALVQCESGTGDVYSCNEQYKDNWIITCVCK